MTILQENAIVFAKLKQMHASTIKTTDLLKLPQNLKKELPNKFSLEISLENTVLYEKIPNHILTGTDWYSC